MLTALFLVTLIIGAAAWIFFHSVGFGQKPSGSRQALIEKSANFTGGQFQNQAPTPVLKSDKGFLGATWDYLFVKHERLTPAGPLPTAKTDLKNLGRSRDLIVWLGHSSFFIQMGGRRILIDPVLSDYASPAAFVNKAFPGSNIYEAADIPDIDCLLITHDHWDHLDYPTVMALKPKIGRVVAGLGVGAHFERWGFDPEIIQEGDWNDELALDGLSVHILPARHFSGRSLTRNKTLWAAFALISPEKRVFISGDSGYGPHFKEIGQRFKGFDLVALDAGQYDDGWPYVHMNPEEAALAAKELKAGALLPAHIGRFSIANHTWDDPFIRIKAASRDQDYQLVTPLIGQAFYLDEPAPVFPSWWEGLK